ncbi:hypothetical protein MJO28_000056 [Puccinia striiformis f. sp. tritici]|uniref:Uncharacterized protein n=1 Tax=Puccinia striiformis f. sp. tritici TaxID=168172 RepID=A0ACC0EX62_9BASI|nr:hypothetical protein MJO28_000056 [Puccinia striiformis f. sp. tritici]KAI7967893.1 hypothetical protein MJO29_001170 [Puccinia striiformis f. sp. tritici]
MAFGKWHGSSLGISEGKHISKPLDRNDFTAVENCIPAAGGPRFNGNSTTQICHLGFWKESKTISACYTKTGAYKCTGEITGFAACTGCRAK